MDLAYLSNTYNDVSDTMGEPYRDYPQYNIDEIKETAMKNLDTTYYYMSINSNGHPYYEPIGKFTKSEAKKKDIGLEVVTYAYEFHFIYKEITTKVIWIFTKSPYIIISEKTMNNSINESSYLITNLYVKEDMKPTPIYLKTYSPNYYNIETLRSKLDKFTSNNNFRFFRKKLLPGSGMKECIKSLVSLVRPLDTSIYEPLGFLQDYEIIPYKNGDYYHIVGIKLTFKKRFRI